MTQARPAVFATRGWYPASESACRRRLEAMLEEAGSIVQSRALPASPVAGLVPHAGWTYSGLTAATVFRALADRVRPDLVVLLGAVHVPGVHRPTRWSGGQWETPLGPVSARDVLSDPTFDAAVHPHRDEHSVELQIPFVRHLWPEAEVAVLMVPPTGEAPGAGGRVAQALERAGGTSLVVGTTDLTHYGPRYGFAPRGVGPDAHRWVIEENDPPLLERIAALDVDGIAEVASRRKNACSVGAIQATVACARIRGAERGVLLHHTTSFDRVPEGTPADFVGYAGFVF